MSREPCPRREGPLALGRCVGQAQGKTALPCGAPTISSSWRLLCVFGPSFTSHQFTTIYQDYNRVPPSLSAYPKPEMIDLAVKDAVQRARVQLAGWEEKDGKILITDHLRQAH